MAYLLYQFDYLKGMALTIVIADTTTDPYTVMIHFSIS